MSKLYLYNKNILPQKLKRFCPPDAQYISEDYVALQCSNDNEAFVCLSIDTIDLADKQIIPTLSIATKNTYGYKCFLRIHDPARDHINEVALAGIGTYPAAMQKAQTGRLGIKADIDSFIIKNQTGSAEFRLHIVADDINKVLKQPFLVTLSVAPASAGGNIPGFTVDSRHDISIPAKSQMLYEKSIRRRICSPTCLSMVLDYYGRATDVLTLAEHAYHEAYDLYGVWPSNIWAATRYMNLGYIHRFCNFDDVKQLLDNDVPLIASIRYKAGELTHAAIKKTLGHLVVLRGYEKDAVIVNDPAAPDEAAAQTAYNMAEFLRVWLGQRGVAYVLIPVT